jgi:hypothetical protein
MAGQLVISDDYKGLCSVTCKVFDGKVRERAPSSTSASVIGETAMKTCDQHVAVRRSVLQYLSRSVPGLSADIKFKTAEAMTKTVEDQIRTAGYTALTQARTAKRVPGTR